MSLIVPPGFLHAAWELNAIPGTPPFVTTLGVAEREGEAPADAANALFDIYASTILPFTWSTHTLVRCSVTVGSTGPTGSVDSTRAPVNGQRTTGQQPPVAMAAILQKTTATYGRSGRGRMYLPGVLTEAGVNQAGNIEGGDLTDLQGAVQDFFDALIDIEEPRPPFLFSSIPPGEPKLITGMSLGTRVGWVRGRLV